MTTPTELSVSDAVYAEQKAYAHYVRTMSGDEGKGTIISPHAVRKARIVWVQAVEDRAEALSAAGITLREWYDARPKPKKAGRK